VGWSGFGGLEETAWIYEALGKYTLRGGEERLGFMKLGKEHGVGGVVVGKQVCVKRAKNHLKRL
jgi:hypothetical protein